MSNQTYIETWKGVSAAIGQQNEYEVPKDPGLVPKDRESALIHLALLYAKYIRILQELENTYDQMLHPQKRRLLRDLLMAIIGRLLEIKRQLVEIDASDFPNMDSILFGLKMVPTDLQIPIPRCFQEEVAKKFADQDKDLEARNAKALPMIDRVPFPEMTAEQAIVILQRNERGRQGRIREKYLRDIRQQEDQDVDLDGTRDEIQMVEAVIKIQKTWRSHKGRQLAKLERRKEDEFLNISLLPSHKARATCYENERRRKGLQKQHEEEYQQALLSIKEKIKKVEGPDMKESYQDSFRQWYMDFKRETGKFPEFPPDEEWKVTGFKFGQINPNYRPASAEADKAAAETEAAAKGGKGKKPDSAGKKDAKKDPKKDAKSGKKGKEVDDEPKQELFNANSNYLRTVQIKNTNYIQGWKSKNEADNFAQRHDVEIIKADKRGEVDTEMKEELFAVLREELENLKVAMEKDSKKKKKDGGKKKKKDKKAGGKKGKKEKDLTGGRPIEELVTELVAAGLMQRSVKCMMNEFKGTPSVVVKDKMATVPALMDIKRVLTENCILPLGMDPAVIDDLVPLPKSFFLYGPTGVGKSMLVNAIATECGATLFNLSPKVTAGQYVGKANVSRMVYTVFKVAKALAPSIVVVDDAEAVYCKKVPKDDTSDPKRARKDLTKAINALKSTDRVIVLGMSRNPFYSDAKAISDAFHKQIMVPRPNYADREMMWREWILERVLPRHFGEAALSNRDRPASTKGKARLEENTDATLSALRSVNFSVLARVSAGASGAIIKAVVERVLVPRRIGQVPRKSLETAEFVSQLISLPEPDRKVEQDFRDWASKLPLMKKREIILGLVPEEVPDPKAKGKGGKDAKGKKK